MKHTIKIAALLALVISFTFSSCKKEEDEGIPPHIVFNTGTGYTSADATLAKGSAIKVGIIASKSEGNDVLTKLTVVRTYDNTTDSTILSYDVPAAEADSLIKDFNYTLRNSAGIEKYTFTVVNKDGIVNSIKLTMTTL